MATLRGATGAAYQNASSSTLTLPSGTVAGDYCVAILGNVWSASSLSGITSWSTQLTLDTWGNTYYLAKKLTSADITAGSVTANFSGTGPGYSAIATASCSVSYQVGYINHTNNSTGGVASNTFQNNTAKTGDIVIYLTTHRRDSTTPTVSISRGSLGNESGFMGGAGNWGFSGGIRYETIASDGPISVTFTYDAAGQGDMAAVWVFTDQPRTGATISPIAASTRQNSGFVYRGRATAVLDSGGVP